MNYEVDEYLWSSDDLNEQDKLEAEAHKLLAEHPYDRFDNLEGELCTDRQITNTSGRAGENQQTSRLTPPSRMEVSSLRYNQRCIEPAE